VGDAATWHYSSTLLRTALENDFCFWKLSYKISSVARTLDQTDAWPFFETRDKAREPRKLYCGARSFPLGQLSGEP
jgi:hypothetical protein